MSDFSYLGGLGRLPAVIIKQDVLAYIKGLRTEPCGKWGLNWLISQFMRVINTFDLARAGRGVNDHSLFRRFGAADKTATSSNCVYCTGSYH